VIKHCAVSCCAPSEKIVDLLNGQKLGASIQEANNDDKEEDASPEYFKLLHGFLVAVLFFVSVSMEFSGAPDLAVLIMYMVCTGLGIVPILYDAGIALYRWSIDIHILMLVAIGGAIGSHEYLDAALVVTLFITAELIEGEVMRRVRNAVKLGVGGMAKNAVLVTGDSIPVDDLKIGDRIACRAGDQVLADGVVVSGNAVIDESALTGEAIPIAKKSGDKVISGTVVQNGYIEVEVDTMPRDSTVRKLNEKVSEVQADRGQFAKVVDRSVSTFFC
jgi:Zn2+/Cd2+-exporting ATPase